MQIQKSEVKIGHYVNVIDIIDFESQFLLNGMSINLGDQFLEQLFFG